jgi:hypothetical protein
MSSYDLLTPGQPGQTFLSPSTDLANIAEEAAELLNHEGIQLAWPIWITILDSNRPLGTFFVTMNSDSAAEVLAAIPYRA